MQLPGVEELRWGQARDSTLKVMGAVLPRWPDVLSAPFDSFCLQTEAQYSMVPTVHTGARKHSGFTLTIKITISTDMLQRTVAKPASDLYKPAVFKREREGDQFALGGSISMRFRFCWGARQDTVPRREAPPAQRGGAAAASADAGQSSKQNVLEWKQKELEGWVFSPGNSLVLTPSFSLHLQIYTYPVST